MNVKTRKGRAPMKKEPRNVPEIDEGSGNVFADVGLEVSDIDMVKVHLALEINRTIQKRKLTQAAAGALMGVDQAKVSKIVRGRLDEFSQDRLMAFLAALGRDIEIRVSSGYRTDRGRVRACS
jgi:predicted XRE-type DNA-binding protein